MSPGDFGHKTEPDPLAGDPVLDRAGRVEQVGVGQAPGDRMAGGDDLVAVELARQVEIAVGGHAAAQFVVVVCRVVGAAQLAEGFCSGLERGAVEGEGVGCDL